MALFRITLGSVLAVLIILSVDPAFGQGGPRDPNDYFKCMCQLACDHEKAYHAEIIEIAELLKDRDELEFLVEQLRDGSKGEFPVVEYEDLIDGFCPLDATQRDAGFRSVADCFINRQGETCGNPDQEELCNMYNEVMETLVPYVEGRLEDGTCKV